MSSYTHKDILAIAKLIPTIEKDSLTNDKLDYWYDKLNTKNKTLTEFINTFTPTINYINISTFLYDDNKDSYINGTEYTINATISPNDPLKLTDPSNSDYSLRYKNATISDSNDLIQVIGTFEEDENGYLINISELKILMTDWRNFDFQDKPTST